MTRPKPYAEYRAWSDSWLPAVPAHWRTGNLRHFADFTTGFTPPTDDDSGYDGDLPWANIADLGPAWIDGTRKTISESGATGRLMSSPGDLLFSFKLSVGTVSRTRVPVFTNEAIATFSESGDLDLAYAYYALPEFVPRNANTNIYGAPLLNSTLIKSAPFAAPPLSEQRAIAAYLDRETGQIDALIAKQQRLIETLRERRAAVVTTAVTRGLDGAPLVDSGNVYLGSIPEGWGVSRLSREVSINGGQVDPRDEPWADMVLVAPNHIEPGTGRLLGRETARSQGADSGKYTVRAGQVMYSKIRPALNKVAIAIEDCLCSADMYALTPRRESDTRFVTYFMRAQPFHTFASLTSMRVKMPKINRDELGEAPWAIPPLNEQRRIADYLDEKTAQIDALIAKAERFIEVSKERRTALITAAVTGQIDVRKHAASNTEQTGVA